MLIPTEFDERQLKQMALLIVRLRNEQVGLNKFIVDQWVLIDLLQNTDSDWKEKYRSNVNSIEHAYASALEQKRQKFNPEEQTELLSILVKLEELIGQYIPLTR